MNIINLSSDVARHPRFFGCFSEDILDETFYHSDLGFPDFPWRHDLFHQVPPIYLVSEKVMKPFSDEFEINNDDSEKPATEYLGIYTRLNDRLFSNNPAIVICPERILECSHRHREDTSIILAKVIIHELAHARMDLENQSSDYGTKDDFYRWIEESMANLITLEYFQNLGRFRKDHFWENIHTRNGDYVFDIVEKFIKSQPPNYKLGWDMYKCNANWWIWSDNKGEISKMEKEKEEWLHYVEDHVGSATEAEITRLLKKFKRKIKPASNP